MSVFIPCVHPYVLVCRQYIMAIIGDMCCFYEFSGAVIHHTLYEKLCMRNIPYSSLSFFARVIFFITFLIWISGNNVESTNLYEKKGCLYFSKIYLFSFFYSSVCVWAFMGIYALMYAGACEDQKNWNYRWLFAGNQIWVFCKSSMYS